jgi:glycosyltransferase involved in cell wall biosynthesis
MPQVPKFTVIIRTFNRASLLLKSVDSVLEQTYGDVEVLVVDDGSTDQTAEALRTYLHQNGELGEHVQ